MKKFFIISIAAGFIATGCNSFNKQKDNTVTTINGIDSLPANEDTTLVERDNTLVLTDTSENSGKRI